MRKHIRPLLSKYGDMRKAYFLLFSEVFPIFRFGCKTFGILPAFVFLLADGKSMFVNFRQKESAVQGPC